METTSKSAPPASSPISPQVEAAWKLTEVGKHAAAIRLLRKYLKAGADDVLAEEELADCLEYTGRYDEALDALDGWLTKRPKHPILLTAKARVKSALGKFDEALALVDEAILAWELAPLGVGWLPPQEFLEQLMSERWSVLYDLQRYGEALELAQAHIRSDPARWHNKVFMTLIAAGRLGEAEVTLPKSSIDAPWDVAVHLINLHRYAEAIPFLQRRLAYLTKPVSRDFSYLLGYMECLVHTGNFAEFERIRAFWSNQKLSLARRKCLRALQCISLYTSGDTTAGVEQLNHMLAGTNQAREIQRMRDEFPFEETGELLLAMLQT